MNTRFLISAISIFITGQMIFSQSDTVFNKVDANGLKQGFWKKGFPNGKIMYQGFFKDDKPFGEMRRFYETGELKAVMVYDESPYVKTKFFYDDGELAAEGIYFEEKKDSVWKYFSYYSGTLTATETYDKGIRSGIEKHYYEEGQVAEEIEWKNDIKNGTWNQYFNDGAPKLKATIVQNKLNGLYSVYYPNGKLYISGHYIDNKRHGKWSFYEDDGQLKSELEYTYGKAENEQEEIEKNKEFFKMVDENLGKFNEPTADDLMPRGGY